jgi:hypothetical protein
VVEQRGHVVDPEAHVVEAGAVERARPDSHPVIPMYSAIRSPDATTAIVSSKPRRPKKRFASSRSVTTIVM